MCVMVFYLCDLCAKVIIIVASQQLHPNIGFASVRIVDRVVSVIGYSIRREGTLPNPIWIINKSIECIKNSRPVVI